MTSIKACHNISRLPRCLSTQIDARFELVISFLVKIKAGDGVRPVELSNPEEIDTEKYLEAMESTFEQVLSALNVDFKSILGKPRQQSLDELFWSKPAS